MCVLLACLLCPFGRLVPYCCGLLSVVLSGVLRGGTSVADARESFTGASDETTLCPGGLPPSMYAVTSMRDEGTRRLAKAEFGFFGVRRTMCTRPFCGSFDRRRLLLTSRLWPLRTSGYCGIN